MKKINQKLINTLIIILIKQILIANFKSEYIFINGLMILLQIFLNKYSFQFYNFISLHFPGGSLQKILTFKFKKILITKYLRNSKLIKTSKNLINKENK
ncbi:hypothetical protein BA768_10835 [Chryseobacterium sp. CBo1]|nr:hypothetical protein BA768_10835 [Chryseobacterium sp. CBo1]